jgi:hypothetical protein
MKKKVSIVLLCLASFFAYGQTQIGLVREINSGKKPLSGVQVIYDDAVPTKSDDNGVFRLSFSGKKPGDFLFLKEISKEGYELVNGRDLNVVKLSNTDRLGEDIILAQKGVIDAAKMEYYDVSDKALVAKFNESKVILQRRLKNAELGKKEYEQQLANLQEQFDIQKESLDELADKFARVNFDDVDALYKNALQLFKSGDIDSCKQLLRTANLIGRADLRLANRKRISEAKMEMSTQEAENEIGIQNDIPLIQLDIQTCLLSFDFIRAEVLHDKLFLVDSSNLEILQSAADFYQNHHRYIKALHLFSKIINHSNVRPQQRINAYGSAALFALFLNRFPQAEEYTLASLSSDSNQTQIFSNLAIAYLFQGKWEDAKTIYIRLQKQGKINDSFKTTFLQDLSALEAAGITHHDVAKARALLQEKPEE